MTREEAIKEWVMPAIMLTWDKKRRDEIIKALEQEPILDKIRAEIEAEKIEGFAARNGGLEIALTIIDKYRREKNNV